MSTPSKQGVALITGASTGIGATYAKRLAASGHDLLIVARDQARLETVATALRKQYGVAVEVLKADLTSKADLQKVEKRLRSDTNISVLVNNAGIAVEGTLLGADPDKLETMIDINITAVMRLAVAAADSFVARKKGTIINIASVLALAPEMFNGSYSGTKAYVLNLSQALQKETAAHGVIVQAVLPGATRTEIWERAGIDLDKFPAEMVMHVDELVDAALAGLDMGETVTLPTLPDAGEWQAYNNLRLAMAPKLSLQHAAKRYGVKQVLAA